MSKYEWYKMDFLLKLFRSNVLKPNAIHNHLESRLVILYIYNDFA